MSYSQLVWFKKDLRIKDHSPLYQAAKKGKCLCLFIYEDDLINADDFDTRHFNFLNQSLIDLRKKLKGLGGNLIIRRGECVEVLRKLHDEHPFETIWAHQETGNWISYQRDLRVLSWAKERGIQYKEFYQSGVVRKLHTRDGWSRIWNQRMNEKIIPAPSSIHSPAKIDSGEILSPSDFDLNSTTNTKGLLGGETHAKQCLETFLSDRGKNYQKEMSSPVTAFDSCSRMSSYLTFGNISIKEVYQASKERANHVRKNKSKSNPEDKGWLKSLSSFQSRLRWHCHFIQKLEDEPEIEHQNINKAYDGLREESFNSKYYEAWLNGQTGYPLIDACMRALKDGGWINFRMRAMLVSFTSYHLWLHWKKPAIELARLFTDYEPGIHYSQIQMQAGVTGINTVRIYSPIKQVTDQDPQGIFIKSYLPELNSVPDHHLAEPHKMTQLEQSMYGCVIGKNYPHPIVNHAEAYKTARDRIHSIKKLKSTKEESKKVFLKHGSRKSNRRPVRA
ncbi:MAG: deoxyribodipyrimidine photo-lyase/cryptochrome family protein [Verrucomicrobiales bacterium]